MTFATLNRKCGAERFHLSTRRSCLSCDAEKRGSITLAFSCGARSASDLMEPDYFRSTLSRRQLQGFVMMPRWLEPLTFAFRLSKKPLPLNDVRNSQPEMRRGAFPPFNPTKLSVLRFSKARQHNVRIQRARASSIQALPE